MQITCPCGKKKFNVESSLIPSSGRLLQCGSCDREWFYKEGETSIDEVNIELNSPAESPIIEKTSIEQNSPSEVSEEIQIPKVTESIISQAEKKIKKNVNKENYIKVKNLNVSKSSVISSFFSYLIVFIISFIGFIILIDTFKIPLINIFPSLENLLFSFFETLKDIKLFINDLS